MSFEPLETRELLAITTPILSPSNDIVFNGDGATDSIVFSATAGELLQHNRGGIDGFNSHIDLDSSTPGDQTRAIGSITSLTFRDSGGNDEVTFAGTTAFNFGNAQFTAMSVSAGTIVVNTDIATTGVGALNLTAQRNIEMQTGASITTVDGAITLEANASATATGDFIGLSLMEVQITSENGDIILMGTGGDTGRNNYGVYVREGSQISSANGDVVLTGTGRGGDEYSHNYGVFISTGSAISSTGVGATASTITANGIGANGGDGVYVAGSRVTSFAGDIQISGKGSTRGSDGVRLAGSAIESVGTSKVDAAQITIDGTGGDGVIILHNAKVTSAAGDIHITGKGVHDSSDGVVVYGNGMVESTGASNEDAATITIEGVGGDGGSQNVGVRIASSNAKVRSMAGDIRITGHGGNANRGHNHGVLLDNGGAVKSAGMSKFDAARIVIDGAGGEGGGDGVHMSRSGSRVSSVAGDIQITGRGSDSTYAYNMGVNIERGAVVESTGLRNGDAAQIRIDGIAGNGANGNDGVCIGHDGAEVTSIAGDIHITGQGGNGTHYSNVGVTLEHGGLVTSTGTSKENAATITIDGTGGNGKSNSFGVRLNSTFGVSRVTAVAGDIHIKGNGGYGFGIGPNHGVMIDHGSIVQSTGTSKSDAAQVTIEGTGGFDEQGLNEGVRMYSMGTKVTSVAGDIHILGNGHADSSSSHGVGIQSGTAIESTGASKSDAAQININGTGGHSGSGTIIGRATVRSMSGDIRIAGEGGEVAGHGVYLSTDAIVESTGARSTDAAHISIDGTGGGWSKGVSASRARVTSVAGGIHIAGDALRTGIAIGGSSVSATGGGNIGLVGSGSSTYWGQGVAVWGSSGVETIGGGNIEVIGTGAGGIGIRATGLDAGVGSVTLTAPVGIIREADAGTDVAGSTVTINGEVACGTGSYYSTGRMIVDGDMSFGVDDALSVELEGPTAVSQYDQVQVIGPARIVDLGQSTLNVSLGFTPGPGDSFTIIDNVDSTSRVVNAFDGLPEGAQVPGTNLYITYHGGADGNDVVLSTNRPPVAEDDNATTDEDNSVVIAVVDNDSDPDGNLDPTTTTATSGPSNGSLVNNGDGSFTYTPNPDFHGTDSFTYEIADSAGETDTATVTITVNSVIDALIDVKPGNGAEVAPINLGSNGKTPIAILATQQDSGETDDFDPTLVDLSVIDFEINGESITPNIMTLEDIDGDGDLDLLLHFLTQDLANILTADSVDLVLTAEFGGDALGHDLAASDAIKIVPPKGKGKNK